MRFDQKAVPSFAAPAVGAARPARPVRMVRRAIGQPVAVPVATRTRRDKPRRRRHASTLTLFVLAAAIVFLAGACNPMECVRHSDCSNGQVCVHNVCAQPGDMTGADTDLGDLGGGDLGDLASSDAAPDFAVAVDGGADASVDAALGDLAFDGGAALDGSVVPDAGKDGP